MPRVIYMKYKNTIFDEKNILTLRELLVRGLTPNEKEEWLVARNKVRKTNALFLETSKESRGENFDSIYTLVDCRPLHYKIYNGMVRYDLAQLYLGCDDITEHEFANKFLYDTHQWEKMCKNTVLEEYIKEWRKEQRLKVKSMMFGVILDDALDAGSKTKTSSAKYLLEKYYDPNTKNNKQVKKEKDEDVRELMDIQEDRARLLNSLKLN